MRPVTTGAMAASQSSPGPAVATGNPGRTESAEAALLGPPQPSLPCAWPAPCSRSSRDRFNSSRTGCPARSGTRPAAISRRHYLNTGFVFLLNALSGSVGRECWHAEVGSCAAGSHLVDLGDLVACRCEADFEAFDLAGPAFAFGFADAVEQVGAHVGEPAALGGVGPQERAAQAGVLVDAGGSVGAAAGPVGDFAPLEVAEELVPLLVGGRAVFAAGPQGASARDERAVAVDDFLRVDRLVSHGGVDVAVAADELGDVRWHAVEDGVGDEDSPEVMRAESQRLPGVAGEPGLAQRDVQQVADRLGADRAVLQAEGALEQKRHRRVPDSLMRVVGGDQ